MGLTGHAVAYFGNSGEEYALLWTSEELRRYFPKVMEPPEPSFLFDTPYPGDGFWLWEGELVNLKDEGEANNFRGEGQFRSLNAAEWDLLRSGKTPINLPPTQWERLGVM